LVQGNFNEAFLLIFLPLILAFLMGSPSGGIILSVPILSGILYFTAKSASLLYMSAYLGYLGAPTHLCLAFTVEYFKSSLSGLYEYLVPFTNFFYDFSFSRPPVSSIISTINRIFLKVEIPIGFSGISFGGQCRLVVSPPLERKAPRRRLTSFQTKFCPYMI